MIDTINTKKSNEELTRDIDRINQWIEQQKINPQLVDHFHDGYDTSRISYTNLEDKKLYVWHTIVGTAAATATNYGVFWIAPVACIVTAFKEVHQTAGTDAGAVTVGLEKLEDGDALGSGDDVLSSALSLKSTINTVQSGTLSATLANRSISAGNRLALEDTGTLTAVANVTVLVELNVV